MPKSFNKIREHYHVPLLLVLINFFLVSAIYYVHGYTNENFSSGEILKAQLSGISLTLALCSLFTSWEPFTKITYIVSLLTVLFIFLMK
ncbi:MAG: hypothetical protein WD426_13790 [Anditalea sp.]